MFGRALVLTALFAGAAAVNVNQKFFSPSAGLEKSVPGGVYEPVQVNTRLSVNENLLDGGNNDFQNFTEANTAFAYCPEIILFSNTSIQWRHHDDTCVVQYNAVTWDGSNPRVRYNQEVTGTLALAPNPLFGILKSFVGALPGFGGPQKCDVNIAGNTYEVAQISVFDGPSQVTFTNVLSRCQQYFNCFTSTPSLGDSVSSLSSVTCLPIISQTKQATPIGPLSITQKANGDYLFTTAFMYSGLGMDPDAFIEEGSNFNDVTSNVNINNGKNPENYNLYNFRVWIAQGTYNALEIGDGPGNDLTMYAASPKIMRFKPRDSVFATSDDVFDFTELDDFDDGLFTYRIRSFQESFSGRQLLTVSTEAMTSPVQFGNDQWSGIDNSITVEKVYLYKLVSRPVSTSQFQKNMIQQWFGGAKQYYTLNNQVAENDQNLPRGITERQDIRERKRKKFRRKKRRSGKRADIRDNRQFKLDDYNIG